MCGIVGILSSTSSGMVDRDLLSRMNEVQTHRGPDEDGIFVDAGVGLGHRRLSIIDLSSGQQPLFNEDNTVVVVFNGEIYNFPELTVELQERGHVFRTHSDTEVIVHAWEEWGEKCVERFRGMFAFAIWDMNTRTMFLARDRLGIKPLYYTYLPNGDFLFASELKSILECKELNRGLSQTAVDNYFTYGYVPDPETIFESVKKLPPGFTMTLQQERGAGKISQYWDVPFHSHGSGMTEEELSEELIERLREAVRIRMIAEVPLGAFLSGGVDSSAIVAMMAGVEGEEKINTCSISFSDPSFDESSYAKMIADKYQTNHFVDEVNPDDFDLLDVLTDLYDEPFADSSAMPTYRVCQLAKKRVTVALSGDGGDENLAGYRRYRWHLYEERTRKAFPELLRAPVFGFLGRYYPKLDWAPRYFRGKSTFQSIARDTVEGYQHAVSIVHDEMRHKMYSSGFKGQLGGYRSVEVLKNYAKNAPTDHPLSLVQYLDMKSYLPGDILTKVDRASMAHALEVRVPLLDHKLVEWISGLDPEMKLKGAEGKYIFKKALEKYLPHEAMYRRKKGFSVPINKWFRGPLKERVRQSLCGEPLNDTGIFERAYLKKMVDEHQSGVREHSSAIWSLLMFDSFVRKNM